MSWPDAPKRRTFAYPQPPSPPIDEMPKPPGVSDLTGQRFGAWIVLGYHGRKHYAQRNSIADYWTVQCACGTVAAVQGRSLRAETSRQCVKCSKGNPNAASWQKLING